MTALTKTIVFAVILTAIAGAIGGWVGIQYGLKQSRQSGVHEMLHHQLGLSPEQEKRISDIEAQFAETRRRLNGDMRAANRELADALKNDHSFSPTAKQAIGRFHAAMGALQEQTILHLLAMREVLTPEQADHFDKTVWEALASEQI